MPEKNKRIRLHGAALRKLYDEVYERDEGCCVVCGRHVPYGSIPHHIDFGASKEDTLENLCLLCSDREFPCHVKAHSLLQHKIAKICKEYIERKRREKCAL